MRTEFLLLLTALVAPAVGSGAAPLERDKVATSAGELEIAFLGHGSLFFTVGGKVIHVDPYGAVADYATLPPANLILVTHAHRDHLDAAALAAVRRDATVVIVAPACEGKVVGAVVMQNGEERTVLGVRIEAVPAYNIVHLRSTGVPYHPKGEGNGYVLTFGDTRVLVAGDTEDVPELKALPDIAVAFLPMNLPYTMTPEMVADLARALRPRILYPYHYGETDPQRLVELLAKEQDIEVRIRSMR